MGKILDLQTDGRKIPRWYFISSTHQIFQLHVFCDSSLVGYGAAAYLRTTYTSGKVKVNLVFWKTRIAPLVVISIPRLELLAGQLASKVTRHITEAFNPQFHKVRVWTDSMVLLGWIRNDADRWKDWVRHRVRQIVKTTDSNEWGHCSGALNPADIASRRASATNLVTNTMVERTLFP